MSLTHRIPAALYLVAAANAQTVWTVGPGGFAQIQPAITAAAPGDVIEVATGIYEAFTLDKALTIAALPGAAVDIWNRTGVVWQVLLRPPAGTTACLVGIAFRCPPIGAMESWSLETIVDSGTVCFEDCRFESRFGLTAPALRVTGARAILRRCVALGFGVGTQWPGQQNPGIACTNADVLATDCLLRGSEKGSLQFGVGGEGLLASGSRVHLVGCYVEGGGDRLFLNTVTGSGPAIGSTANTRLWLADCTIRGGSSTGGPGAAGIVHAGPLPLEYDRTTITGGSGYPAGPPIQGLAANVALLGVAPPTQPLLLGQLYAIDWRAQPGWPIVVCAATGLATPSLPVVEPVALAPASATALVFLLADAAGAARFATTLPATPALRHARVFVQAVAGLSLPLRTSPPLGYLAR